MWFASARSAGGVLDGYVPESGWNYRLICAYLILRDATVMFTTGFFWLLKRSFVDAINANFCFSFFSRCAVGVVGIAEPSISGKCAIIRETYRKNRVKLCLNVIALSK